jgi:hypothetical protein
MGKRKGDQPTPTPQAPDQSSQAKDLAATEPAAIATSSDASAAPATEAVKAEAPASPVAATADAATPLPSAPSFVTSDAPKLDASQSEAADTEPPAAPPKPIVLYRMAPRDEASAAEDAETSAAAAESPSSWQKMRRIAPLAASIAIAAAVGAMAGSAATAGLGGLRASPAAPTKSADIRPLRDTIAHLNTEVAALKASIDTSGRTSHAQLTKLGDRLDRVERAQAEPTAKLSKLAEAVDRIEHRPSAPANTAHSAPAISAHDVTGSIAAPATQPAAAPAARASNPPVLDGWFVRSVYHGAALIQTRYGGIIEVEPGDNLPGLGRIENIHRQDGRWVVVTSRGRIVAR